MPAPTKVFLTALPATLPRVLLLERNSLPRIGVVKRSTRHACVVPPNFKSVIDHRRVLIEAADVEEQRMLLVVIQRIPPL